MTQYAEKKTSAMNENLPENEIEKLNRLVRETTTTGLDHDDDRFFRNLAFEMSGQLKELAMMIIDFRKDLKSRIHPHLTDIATKYIPQAADQLEGIIETTEAAANTIMDNLEAMQQDLEESERLVAGFNEGCLRFPGEDGTEMEIRVDGECREKLAPFIRRMASISRKQSSLISDCFVQMSFQDLTGQRIKRIISLVSQIEEKTKRMVLSFGLRLNEREKNPGISSDELNKVVEEKVAELAGPQKAGQGLDQSDIDDLLANL